MIYARRVREFSACGYGVGVDGVSSEAYQVLSMQTSTLGQYILPNLHSLRWDVHPWTNAPFIRLFLNPGLANVHIQFPNPRPDVYRLAAISSIPTKDLAQLRLKYMGNEGPVLDALQNLLDKSSETIRSVALDGGLSTAFIDRLFQLRNLRSLEIELPSIPISSPEVVLPSLKKLAIRYRDDVPWFHILKKIPNPALRDLEATFLDDSLTHIQTLTSSLIHANKKQTLTRLQCSWEKLTPLTVERLRSVFPLERLTTLNLLPRCIEGRCGVQLEDSIICELAKALPRLKSLKLGGVPCKVFTPNVTIESLAALSTNCVDLDFLQLHFDANKLVSSGSYTDYQSRTFTSRLRTLSVGSQPLPSDNKNIILIAFALIRIFPHVEELSHAEGAWKQVKLGIGLLRNGPPSSM